MGPHLTLCNYRRNYWFLRHESELKRCAYDGNEKEMSCLALENGREWREGSLKGREEVFRGEVLRFFLEEGWDFERKMREHFGKK